MHVFDLDMQVSPQAFPVLHRAKGLEFDQVIVILDNTIPLDVDDEDNTPNLIYVSLTRARSLATLIELRSQ